MPPFRRSIAVLVIAAAVAWTLPSSVAQPSGTQPAAGQPSAGQPATEPAAIAPPVGATEPEAKDRPPEVVIILRDGQRYQGFLLKEAEDEVLVRLANIPTTIPRGQIETMQVLPPVLTRYRQMRDAIDDTDAERLVALAEWLVARGEDETALRELEQLLEREPTHVEARRLKLFIVSQQELERQAKLRAAQAAGENAPGAEAGAAGAAGPAAARRGRVEPFPVLTDAQINLIRVFEVDLADPPRMVVERKTIDKLFERHAGDPDLPGTPEGREALYRASPAEVLDRIFRVRARDLYGEVKVLDHPRSMRLFRDDVHRAFLVNACATSRCHGGAEAGRLRLASANPNSDATVYTNFLILERFRLADGRPLIDYAQPGRSPLLHMGLARNRALTPHPVVPSPQGRGDLWRPIFRTPDDERFVRAVQWMTSMYRPRPEYPIEYTPPGASAPVGPPAPAVER